jgi:hypothetical protein
MKLTTGKYSKYIAIIGATIFFIQAIINKDNWLECTVISLLLIIISIVSEINEKIHK